jgi:hypothetical protein
LSVQHALWRKQALTVEADRAQRPRKVPQYLFASAGDRGVCCAISGSRARSNMNAI